MAVHKMEILLCLLHVFLLHFSFVCIGQADPQEQPISLIKIEPTKEMEVYEEDAFILHYQIRNATMSLPWSLHLHWSNGHTINVYNNKTTVIGVERVDITFGTMKHGTKRTNQSLTLTIRKVRMADRGLFTCKLDYNLNNTKSGSVSDDVTLIVKKDPVCSIDPNSNTLKAGTNVTFNCSSDHNQPDIYLGSLAKQMDNPKENSYGKRRVKEITVNIDWTFNNTIIKCTVLNRPNCSFGPLLIVPETTTPLPRSEPEASAVTSTETTTDSPEPWKYIVVNVGIPIQFVLVISIIVVCCVACRRRRHNNRETPSKRVTDNETSPTDGAASPTLAMTRIQPDPSGYANDNTQIYEQINECVPPALPSRLPMVAQDSGPSHSRRRKSKKKKDREAPSGQAKDDEVTDSSPAYRVLNPDTPTESEDEDSDSEDEADQRGSRQDKISIHTSRRLKHDPSDVFDHLGSSSNEDHDDSENYSSEDDSENSSEDDSGNNSEDDSKDHSEDDSEMNEDMTKKPAKEVLDKTPSKVCPINKSKHIPVSKKFRIRNRKKDKVVTKKPDDFLDQKELFDLAKDAPAYATVHPCNSDTEDDRDDNDKSSLDSGKSVPRPFTESNLYMSDESAPTKTKPNGQKTETQYQVPLLRDPAMAGQEKMGFVLSMGETKAIEDHAHETITAAATDPSYETPHTSNAPTPRQSDELHVGLPLAEHVYNSPAHQDAPITTQVKQKKQEAKQKSKKSSRKKKLSQTRHASVEQLPNHPDHGKSKKRKSKKAGAAANPGETKDHHKEPQRKQDALNLKKKVETGEQPYNTLACDSSPNACKTSNSLEKPPEQTYNILDRGTAMTRNQLLQYEQVSETKVRPQAKPYAILNLNESAKRGPDEDLPYEVPRATCSSSKTHSPKTSLPSNERESYSSPRAKNGQSSTTCRSLSSRGTRQADDMSTRNSHSSQKPHTEDPREEHPYKVPRLLSPKTPLTPRETKATSDDQSDSSGQDTQSDASGTSTGNQFQSTLEKDKKVETSLTCDNPTYSDARTHSSISAESDNDVN